jgi:glycosyltransferase involved in cell wall biosynthesis
MSDVSIVIINHNYAAYLADAIESALGQTGGVPEIIVVDDGSTDGSAGIINSFAGAVKAIFKPAGGHVSAVNAGFAACRGNIVIFLDADDMLYPDCVQTIRQHWCEDDAKLQYRLDTIDGLGRNQNMVFPYFPPDLTPAAIHAQSRQYGTYPWTVSSGNAFSRVFLTALLPIDSDEIYRSPDGFLSKMAPLFGDVRSIADVLGAYRVHGSNSWAQDHRSLKIEPIIRWLDFDRVLQSRFTAIAASRGIAVCRQGNEHHTQHLEHRLIAKRLAGRSTPYAADWLPSLCIKSIRAAFHAPNKGLAGRAAWAVWFGFLTIMPKPLIARAIQRGRLQTGRNPFLQMIVRLARGPASR